MIYLPVSLVSEITYYYAPGHRKHTYPYGALRNAAVRLSVCLYHVLGQKTLGIWLLWSL